MRGLILELKFQLDGEAVEATNDPRLLLAKRLRQLREEQWPRLKVTQAHLAQAFGTERAVSVPLISSWESLINPRIPPVQRLQSYAAFFATRRSMDSTHPRLLGDDEFTDDERAERNRLANELLRLRADALRTLRPSAEDEVIESLSGGYWRFDDKTAVTIVCAQLPDQMLDRIPYSRPSDPDYVALYAFADLDAFVELFGHIRASNPAKQVNYRTVPRLGSDDYSAHLVSLGGVDWNHATQSIVEKLALPVVQVPDWDSPDGPYFEVRDGQSTKRYCPVLSQHADQKVLREDVALFARAVNPFNRLSTVTICSGMYASGTFGAVRALTDATFRDRNSDYARTRFGHSENFCILTRIRVEHGVPVSPDWTLPENRLFEWASD